MLVKLDYIGTMHTADITLCCLNTLAVERFFAPHARICLEAGARKKTYLLACKLITENMATNSTVQHSSYILTVNLFFVYLYVWLAPAISI